MVYHVQFPGLGLEFTVNRVAFSVFGVPIYWYGVLIAAGMLLALVFAFRYARSFGIDADRMIDAVLIGTAASIVGGRIYYVAMAPFRYESFAQMLDIRQGGMAIYGCVIGAFLGGFLACKWRKVPVLPMFDLTVMGFLLGQGIGRWGNFVNQEAFGTNTALPWGMISEGTREYLTRAAAQLAAQGVTVDPALPVHPTFLYESIWCLLGFFLLWAYMRRRRFHGEIFLLYFAWYGLERFFVEGLRTDSLMIGPVRASQVFAAVTVIVSLTVWAVLRRKTRGRPLRFTMYTFPKVDGKKASCTVVWEQGTKPPTDADIAENVRALRAQDDADGPSAYFMTWIPDEEAAAPEKEEPDGGTAD